MNKLYLRLFHGRNSPDEDLDDCGFDGPIIGPFDHFEWTYGNLRISDETSETYFAEEADLIAYDGKFYGDFSVTTFPPSDSERYRPVHSVLTARIKREYHRRA